MQTTFGEHVEVKLDIFHAVKRVSGALSKKHPHFYGCIQDFRLVFRSRGDNGVERKEPTPPPEVLKSNLQVFLDKWTTITPEGHPGIITTSVVKEIENLKRHMDKGCLSGIPASFGTNRNENLHRSINHRLSGHRIGVEIAVALISVFFHTWNKKRSGQPNTSIYADFLRSSSNCDTQVLESSSNIHHLGIGVSATRRYSEQQLGTAFSNKELSSDTLEVLKQIDELKNDLPSPREPPETLHHTSMEIILNILQYALSCVHLENTINALSNTHPKVSRVTPHLSSLIDPAGYCRVCGHDSQGDGHGDS